MPSKTMHGSEINNEQKSQTLYFQKNNLTQETKEEIQKNNIENICCQGINAKPESIKEIQNNIENICCQGISAKPESIQEIQNNIENICCQGISAKPESIQKIQKNVENIKLRKILEKIRKYHILDDEDFNYIKLLPNDQMMKFIRNLQ
jgi:nitrate reductase NapAB chaperone NapD